jgi:hypothetical protein
MEVRKHTHQPYVSQHTFDHQRRTVGDTSRRTQWTLKAGVIITARNMAEALNAQPQACPVQ